MFEKELKDDKRSCQLTASSGMTSLAENFEVLLILPRLLCGRKVCSSNCKRARKSVVIAEAGSPPL